MDYKKILIGSAIYIVIAILIGYFVSSLAIYAAAIAALLAGVYTAKLGASAMKAAMYGVIVGLVGGILGGILSVYLPTLTGVSLAIPMGGWLNSLLASVFTTAVPWLAVPSMAIVGMVFGLIGGYVGKKYLKQ